MEFVYLQPGNWFELKNMDNDKKFPYDLGTLSAEILNQVKNRSTNLDFIDIHFGSKYKKKEIEDIVFYLDEEKFSLIQKMIENETRHPIITFHGTTSATIVESILQKGYIIPGTNKTVKVRNGTAYGAGIYTSPHLDKCLCYTQVDNSGYVYVLINLLFLGKFKLIPPNNSAPSATIKNGTYSNGFNTHIVYGLEQLISADSKRVMSVAVMKIKI